MPARTSPKIHSHRLVPERQALLACVGSLTLLSALVHAGEPLGDPRGGLAGFVNLGLEGNLPTWFSALCLAAAAAVAARRAPRLADPARRRTWLLFAVVLAALSVDEVVGIHEAVNDWLGAHGPLAGRMRSPWVVPGLIAGGGVALVAIRIGSALRPRVRRRLLVGVAALLGGAIGLETVWVLNGPFFDLRPAARLVLMHAEESLELLGVALLLAAVSEADESAEPMRPLATVGAHEAPEPSEGPGPRGSGLSRRRPGPSP